MRLWPVVGIIFSAVMTVAIVSTLINDEGLVRESILGESDEAPLIIYGLLTAVALISAMLIRSWFAIILVPVTMLAAWVLFDRIACPGCWQDYGMTYSLPLPGRTNMLSAAEAHVALRSLQLLPAVLAAILGALLGTRALFQRTAES